MRYAIERATQIDFDNSIRRIPGFDVCQSGLTWTLTPRERRKGKIQTVVVSQEDRWISVKYSPSTRRRPLTEKGNRKATNNLIMERSQSAGLLKPVLDSNSSVLFRADIRFTVLDQVEHRISQVLDEACRSSGNVRAADRPNIRSHDTQRNPDIAQALEESSWPYRRLDDGSYVVDLESGRGFRQAFLEFARGGRTSLETTLFEGPIPAKRNLHAISTYLLLANTYTRMASFELRGGKKITARAKVLFPTAPIFQELASALESLSIASAGATQVIPALMGDAVAIEYLTAQQAVA